MSKDTIKACPKCDGSNLKNDSAGATYSDDLYCQDCRELVTPVKRATKGHRNTQSKTARKLLDMDADSI